FPGERRTGPPSRREDYPYRGPREDSHTGRPIEFGEDRDHYRRKAAPFPPIRERSPVRREVARSPHSRSGSSVSSRGYSPDRAKGLPFPSQQVRRCKDATRSCAKEQEKGVGCLMDIPEAKASTSGHFCVAARSLKKNTRPVKRELPTQRNFKQGTESSQLLATGSVTRRNSLSAGRIYYLFISPTGGLAAEEAKTQRSSSSENFLERRARAIAAKAQEIEKVYRQDCETFGMVVKMLVAKDPNLEKQLQVPLRENLGEIRERCLEDLKHFINELDEAIRQPEPS
uniref:Periphilin 1 n=1 Tax=Tetraodon nigroviridis TaxID=99883 RepID=H3DMC8_TETNG